MKPPKAPASYEVGRGKPPMQHRFPKGTSGNPAGRPKGAAAASPIDKALERPITLTIDGKRRTVPATEALTIQTISDGLKGDKVARRDALRLAERREGAKLRAAAIMPAATPSPPPVTYKITTYSMATLEALGLSFEVNGVEKVPTWAVEEALARLSPEKLAQLDWSELALNVEDSVVLDRYRLQEG